MLRLLLTLVHILVSLFLIVVVLLQTGKRADLAGAFGGGGSQTAFGARGAVTFFAKMTTTAAVIFMITSLGLAILSTGTQSKGKSALDETAPANQSAPATPGKTPPAGPSNPGNPAGPNQGAPGSTEKPSTPAPEQPAGK